MFRAKRNLLVFFLLGILTASCGQKYPAGVKFYSTDPAFLEIDWSNDSTKIVGTSFPLPETGFLIGAEPSEVFIWNPKTNIYTQVSDTAFSKWNDNPVWHPQADEIFYYSSQEFGEDFKIGKIEIETGQKTNLLHFNGPFDVLSDGNTLILGMGERLFLGVGLNLESIWFSGRGNLIDDNAISVDDRYIAATTHHVDSDIYSLYKVKIEDRDEQLLYESQSTIRHPEWSPDSKWVVVTHGRWDVMAIAADGSCVTSRLPVDGGINDISWSPDGKQLALAINQNRGFGIMLIQTDSEFFQDWLRSGNCF